MKPLKSCHGYGHTVVCYDISGAHVITGGKDSKVCIWEGPDDTDTTSITMGAEIYALSCQDGRLFASTSQNLIQMSTFPEGLNDGVATRFAAPCRHFEMSKNGKKMVAGSDEFKIKVLTLDENECTCDCTYIEHEAPILSVSLDPKEEFVASSSCDGTVKVWDMFDGTTEISTKLLDPCNHPNQAESLCMTRWSQDGEFLLVPVGKKVQILLRSSWAVTKTIENSCLTDTINVMALSVDGKHLAVGCVNGFIGIFDWQNGTLVDRQAHPHQQKITSIAWNPTDPSQLAFCDNMGQLGFLENLKTAPQNADSSGVADTALDKDFEKDSLDHSNLDGDGLDIDDENIIDIGSIKRKYNLDDNDGSVTSAGTDQPLMPEVPLHAHPVKAEDSFKPTPMQPPFQPGSTPEHLSSRFMMWNSVGTVRQNISDEDYENSIDVEFHNAATHHSLHIDNNSDYVMADLSSQALVLASRGDDEISKLFCMHFGSWDGDKEWSVNMPEGESIQSITVTDNWLAAATDCRFVRIFSISGMQCQMFSTPGNIVAMGSSGNTLMMVYHKAMGIPGDQCLGITIAKVKGRKKSVSVKDETLPLSPKSRLSWLGFSDEGTPYYMDSEGVVRMMSKGHGQLWFPVCHTRHHVKGKSDHYWIVGVNERHQQIRCIPCKGSQYPATVPRPAIAILSFQINLCDGDSEMSRYEESYQRGSLIAHNMLPSHDTELIKELKTPLRESLMKLFALASKSGKDFRALEVCDMIEDQDLLEIAATYATRLKRIQLAERVNQVLSSRQNDVGSDDEDVEVDDQIDADDEDRFTTANFRSKTQSDDEDDEGMDDDDIDEPINERSDLLLNTKQDGQQGSKQASFRKNPFRLSTPKDQSLSKGSNVFDKVQKKTPKPSPVIAPLPVTIKRSAKKGTNQGKLTGFNKREKQDGDKSASPELKKENNSVKDSVENQPLKKKLNGFDLWFEQSVDDLREEHPELAEEDLATKAVGVFQQLPKEERQSWVQKAKSLSGADDGTLKRKLSSDSASKDTDTSTNPDKKSKTEKKTPLSQTTNAKLAMFAKGD